MVIDRIVARKGEYKKEDFSILETVELSWEDMSKRRLRTKTDRGRQIDLNFPEGNVLRDGDLLYRDDQVGICVRLLPERALSIHPGSNREFAVICYELGNRHLPAWIGQDEILVLDDPVLKLYLYRLGVPFEEQLRVFDEPGLTAVGGGKEHDHRHSVEAG